MKQQTIEVIYHSDLPGTTHTAAVLARYHEDGFGSTGWWFREFLNRDIRDRLHRLANRNAVRGERPLRVGNVFAADVEARDKAAQTLLDALLAHEAAVEAADLELLHALRALQPTDVPVAPPLLTEQLDTALDADLHDDDCPAFEDGNTTGEECDCIGVELGSDR